MKWMTDQVLEGAKIDSEDLTLLTVTDSVAEAVRILLEAYRNQGWLDKK